MSCDYALRYLTYDSSVLGVSVDGLTSNFSRVEGVSVRQNFWTSKARLDGSYPALVWNYRFFLFVEEESPKKFAKFFNDLSDNVKGVPKTLNLTSSTTATTPDILFGACYMQVAELQSPDRLLFHKAGIIALDFIGNTKPIVTV